MKQTINFTEFRDAFKAHDRMENFSYDGAALLFEWLEQYEDETGEELELDVIALCCDYNEDTVQDIIKNYSIDVKHCRDGDDETEIVLDYLNNNTIVIGCTDEGTIVYAVF